MICSNFKHAKKAEYSIFVTEKGMVIFVNDKQNPKAYEPIKVTEEGMVISVNDEHLLKVELLISVIEEGIVICFKLEQFSKTEDPSARPTFDEIAEMIKNKAEEFVTEYGDLEEFKDYINFIESSGQERAFIDDNIYGDDDDDDEVDEYNDEPLFLDVKTLDLQNFEKREKIGFGGFGKVYKINEIKTGRFYACKFPKKIISEKTKYTATSQSFIQEVEIHAILSHPSIVNFIGYSGTNFKKKLKPAIIIEYLKNDSLEKLLELERLGFKSEVWDDTMRLINIYGIAASMKYLHSHDIIHRDLKPDNVILDYYLFPKLSDFGFSVKIDCDEYIDKDIVGTPSFISPEIYQQVKYTKWGDVYAFGMLVYEIMNKKFPFSGKKDHEIMNLINMKKHIPEIDHEKVPERYIELIEACLNEDPYERPTFEKIVEDLKNDEEFITANVDKKKFEEFIKFIEKGGSKACITHDFPFHMIDLQSVEKEFKESQHFLLGKVGFLNLKKYEKQDKIKNYAVSSVYKVKDRMSGKIYSAKIANVIQNYSEEEMKDISKEVEQLKEMKHPSIQRIVGFSIFDFNDQLKPVVIGEYSTDRTLRDIIQTERKGQIYPGWNDTKRLINIYGIASGMLYLHSHGVLHPKISTKNIYVDESLYPKLSEIGTFIQVENSRSVANLSARERGINPISIAPEVFKSKNASEMSDVYSYSFIVYEIMTNEIPFKTVQNLNDLYNEVVVKKSRPSLSNKQLPEIYKQLIETCWSEDPESRPSFDVIVDNLEKNQEFITNKINKKEYFKYVNNLRNNIQKSDRISFCNIT
ncbi:hypothetical protein M9Y10_031164 [Tritrichomonas musculus]|uniref:Protein kinase domain-containing protein n=1 Tax=Tritrichomonas musculus TaxID=1915356 RepID=A0ABR2H1Z3_9EUKA